MKSPKKLNLKSGFTIVELLIVIIVIAILATLVITAYNGVQTKAKNTKTVSAVGAWAKALRLYQVDNDDFPSIDTCLGNSDTYPSGECEPGQSVSGSLSALEPYFGSGDFPEPDVTKVTNPSDPDDYRSGISYWSDGDTAYIWYVILGADSCPSIGELSNNQIQDPYNGGIQCVGQLDE